MCFYLLIMILIAYLNWKNETCWITIFKAFKSIAPIDFEKYISEIEDPIFKYWDSGF